MFAIVGSLGTEVNLAIRPYLNSKKVPQMLVSTGATTWGADWKQYPWTTGWQPDYQLEGRFYGQTIARNSPNAQDRRPLPERRLRQGLHQGPRGRPRQQDVEHRRQGAVRGHRAERRLADREAEGERRERLRDPRHAGEDDPGVRDGDGAEVVAGGGLHELRLGHRHVPHARQDEYGAGDLVNRTFTTQYAKDPANPKWDNDAGMKLYKQVMAKYYPKGRVTDALNLYGVATAHAFTQLLYAAGKNPTAPGMMKAFRSWNEANPFLLPGVKQRTNRNDEPVPDQVRADGEVHGRGTFQPVSRRSAPRTGT